MTKLTHYRPLFGALCLAAAMQQVLAQSDQVIYNDGLQNGWQDWSWCTRDLSNSALRFRRPNV